MVGTVNEDGDGESDVELGDISKVLQAILVTSEVKLSKL